MINRNKKTNIAMALIILLFCMIGTLYAETSVSSIFNDNMVLQRDKDVPIWGWAQAGEKITVTFAGQTKSGIAASNGKWMIKLAPMKANRTPSVLVIKGVDKTITINNVLIGEVWICAGQSNMGMVLAESFGAEKEIAEANYPELRMLQVDSSMSSMFPMADFKNKRKWQVCTPEVAAGFAAPAYFFARKLLNELKIPIGVIKFHRGATGLEGWVPLEGYKNASELQHIYREVSSWDSKSKLGRKAHLDTFAQLKIWLPQAKQAISNAVVIPPLPVLPAPRASQSDPCEIYNSTVSPLVPVAIRGVVWYQGESNPGEGKIYLQKLQVMIKSWRQMWKSDLPFYIIQLANEGEPAREPTKEDHFRYVPVREAQRRCVKMPGTGLVVAIDLGEDMNGHPRNKKDVGERAALWALAKDYGRNIPFSGPLYRESHRKGDSMIVSFDHVDSGLMIADKDGLDPVYEVKDAEMKYFAVAGKDGVWHWADAKIVGNTIVVRSVKVPVPVEVRYAYCMNPKGPKLYNRAGLPASPFISEKW